MTDTDALKRFWELANELTTRHDANNELSTDIYKQIADLKVPPTPLFFWLIYQYFILIVLIGCYGSLFLCFLLT